MAKKNNTTEIVPITRADLRKAGEGAPALANNPFANLGAGVIAASAFEMPRGAVVRSMSPMVRPADFPVGVVLVGKFTKMFETNPSKKKKGVGIEIVPHDAPVGVAVPAVATIAQGLEIDDTDLGAKAKSPHLGKTIALQRLDGRLKSKKGADAWHFVVAIMPDGFAQPGLAAPGHVAAVAQAKK